MAKHEAKLRSRFEPGTTRWAVRRSQWLAMGLTEDTFDKPKVAVVNSSSKLSVCFQHLDDVAKFVCNELQTLGVVPFEIRTVAPSDFVTSAGKQGRYLMPSRDLLVNDVEVQVAGAELDAMILLASCDKTTPGQLMAAGRLNIPAIIVPCGYQLGGQCGGRAVDIEDIYKGVGSVKSGRMSLFELSDWTKVAIRGPGVCAGLGTANSMHIMAEALGMTLPGAAPVRAGSAAMYDNAKRSAQALVEMIASETRPRSILTAAAFRNAVRVACAIGASVNCVRHLTAIAIESGVDVDILAAFETEGGKVPLLTEVRPNGQGRIEDLEAAGGARAVLARIVSVLESAATVNGRSIIENVAGHAPADTAFVKTIVEPAQARPGLSIVRGSLAPIGAVVKTAAMPREMLRFQGQARVYENENEAIAALGRNAIMPGEVIVLRMMGPLGGPGTVFAASFMAALVGAGLGEKVAVVTDGELSGLNRGITVGQVMPEAAEGGPLAFVADGDMIDIDLASGRLDLLVDDPEISRRRLSWTPPDTTERGWLYQYRRLVAPLARGAVLCKDEGADQK
jgi:dihydroxy-acid dehydratase